MGCMACFCLGIKQKLKQHERNWYFSFIDLTKDICQFFGDNFFPTKSQNNLICALKRWVPIVKFLRRSIVIHKSDTITQQKINIENYHDELDT